MQSTSSQISDSTILTLIRETNLKGLELLYDKYASAMYSVIFTHTADKAFAEEILISLFIRLKQEQRLLKIDVALGPCMLRYNYTNTLEELKKRGIKYTEIPNIKNSILHIICSQYTTIKKISDKLKMSKMEVMKPLQKKFFMLRNNNAASNKVSKQEGNIEHGVMYD